MQRFEVLIDGQPSGFIEALDSVQAVAACYSDPTYGPRVNEHRANLQLRRDYSAGMYILFDVTNNKAIARHDSMKALAALGLIQFANVDLEIIGTGQNKHFSVFDAKQLDSIAEGLGITLQGDYATKLKTLRHTLETVEWLQLPFTTAQLEAQAYGIDPCEAKPLAFDPNGSEARPLKKWPAEPQRNRERRDATHWHMFAAGLGHGPGVTTEATLAHLAGEEPSGEAPARRAPPAPSGARSRASAPPKPPKPPRAPSAPATRPKEGTATGKVWEFADRIYEVEKPVTDWKAFRAELNKQCTDAGINAGTVNVQYGKWKSSLGL